MRIKSMAAKNFRTLEDVSLDFSSFYTVICGKNNSGKSNVLRIIQCIFSDDDPYRYDRPDVSHKVDYTAWRRKDDAASPITISLDLEVDRSKDRGLVEFIERLGSLGSDSTLSATEQIALHIDQTVHADSAKRETKITFGNHHLDHVVSLEVMKRLKASRSMVYHNSTQATRHYYPNNMLRGLLSNLSPSEKTRLETKKAAFTKEMTRLTEARRDELRGLLGRLEERYDLKLSPPEFNFEGWPFEITLGEKDFDVPLDDWGSGTKNRTLILKSLFDAKSATDRGEVSDRIVPIVVIEEPESFLHPLAQAKFGAVLQDLTDELQVQVIATTHSPYLLSHRDPAANILLSRRETRAHALRGTVVVPTTGDRWQQPFEHALGIIGPEFDVFKSAIFSRSNTLIMVEGDTDREYLELCRCTAHKDKALTENGDIFAYGGYGALQNAVLLRFIRDRFSKVVVTFDLDAERHVTKTLEAIGLKRDLDYFPVGVAAAGQRSIEGLLPQSVKQAVREQHPELVDALGSDDKAEQVRARDQLKKLYLGEFKKSAVPGDEYYGEFYKLVKKLNKAIKRQPTSTLVP